MENQQGQFYSPSKACNAVWPQRTVWLFLYFNRATIIFFKKKKKYSIIANEKRKKKHHKLTFKNKPRIYLHNEIGYVWLHQNQEVNFIHKDYLKWVFQLTVTSWINPQGDLSLCDT